jgi:hypothetical protein
MLWHIAMVLMCTVLLGLMGCKESDPLSSEKEITAFNITLKNGEEPKIGVIDPVTRTIVVTLPVTTQVTWLVPAVTISDLAVVSPASGMEVDFSAPKTYTVTAEDGTTQDYLVTVNVELGSSAKDITVFSLKAKDADVDVGKGAITGQTIIVPVPQGTDLTQLIPAFTASPSASVSDADGTPVKTGLVGDFSAPVYYTVTAQDGSTKEYVVIVKIADEAVGLSIDLVKDSIVSLFGITKAELDSTTTGILLHLEGSNTRREAVVSLTGFDNNAPDKVTWVVDSGNQLLPNVGNVFTIKASSYTIGRHWVEVTGTKNGVQYSKTFYFTVDK